MSKYYISLPPTPKCTQECNFIRIFDRACMWETLGETRYLHSSWHALRCIECCCFSLDIGIHGKYHLVDNTIFCYTTKEALVVELVWSHSLYGRDSTTEDMVASTIDSRTLDREHVEVVLDNTEEMLVTLVVSTDTTESLIHIRHRMTLFALVHLGMEIRERLREVGYIGTIGLKQKKCELCRSLFSYSGKEVYHVYHALECFRHI